MPDILIHRCTLRVVRRGGWNWGPEPKRLLQNVVRQVPELLARKLERVFAGAEDIEFSAPLQLRIPIQLGDLLSDVSSSAHYANAPPDAMASLETKLEFCLKKACGLQPTANVEATQSERFDAPSLSVPDDSAEEPHTAGAIGRLLAQWFAAGLLEDRLVAFSRREIEAWHHALWRQLTNSEVSADEPDSTTEDCIHTLVNARESSFPVHDRQNRLRLRLFIATSVAAQLRIPLDSHNLVAALNRILPVENAGADAFDQITTPVRLNAVHKRSDGTRRIAEGEVHVDCALPFLLLGPLTRLGYLETLAAVLEAAELSDQTTLFAASLAFKALDAPERGWRRTPQSSLAASAFAGLEEAPSNESLLQFSRQIAPHTGPLHHLLTDSLLRGHVPGDAVVLRRAELETSSGFMLTEVTGCFPLAWTEEVHQLLPSLQQLSSPMVLISREAAGPQILRQLDKSGISFVTDVPPTRNEPWKRIQQSPALLGWTNHAYPDSEPLLRAARDFHAATDEATALWETFAVARPGVIHDSGSQLDRSLTMAVAMACGMIAWKLWWKRGRTTPQIVIERFCDLDGRIRFNPEAITVRLPLGRRHQELLESGLLHPVRGIPWFGNRPVEFSAG